MHDAAQPRPRQQPPRLPWPPLLSATDVQRGITYHGTGGRLQAVAAKLLAGQPIKAYTLGGSVTKGQGTSTDGAAYPNRFFEFIQAAFPHRWAGCYSQEAVGVFVCWQGFRLGSDVRFCVLC